MKFSIILSFCIASLFGSLESRALQVKKDVSKAKNVSFCVIFPRSGNHWMQNCITLLTQTPISSLAKKGLIRNRFNDPINPRKPICFATHFPKVIKNAPRDTNRLLIVVRNYKECLLRQAIACKRTFDLATDTDLMDLYASIIQCYDTWHPDKRLLIYYEDLITKPAEAMHLVSQFFNGTESQYHQFMEKYEFYKKRSRNYYHRTQNAAGGSMTGGNQVLYHSVSLTDEDKSALDQAIRQRLGDAIFDKYLSRYVPE